MTKAEWEEVFITMLKKHHKRNIKKMAQRLLKKTDAAKGSLVSRSKKYNVECKITTDELRQLVLDYYGTECKYLKRILTIQNLVFDHATPISKGGSSNIDNIQIICRAANNIKGSLPEADLMMLLNWLDTVPEELRKDILIRLAGGKR